MRLKFAAFVVRGRRRKLWLSARCMHVASGRALAATGARMCSGMCQVSSRHREASSATLEDFGQSWYQA